MDRFKADLATLHTLCSEQGMIFEPATLEQLVRYGVLLEQWNHKINLISRKEDAPVIVKHIFHSILISLYHPFRKGEKVLDLGTGGDCRVSLSQLLFLIPSFFWWTQQGKK